VDPHGNAISYSYQQETNYYGRNLKAIDETSYVRGGYLDHIDYGLRSEHRPAARGNSHESRASTARFAGGVRTFLTCRRSTATW
jgi:hypothetical protein